MSAKVTRLHIAGLLRAGAGALVLVVVPAWLPPASFGAGTAAAPAAVAQEPQSDGDGSTEGTEAPIAVLVQGTDLQQVIAAVRAVGGEITHELAIIDAVGARLTASQIAELEEHDDTLKIQPDRKAVVSDAGSDQH